MTIEQQTELSLLDAEERAGKCLTGEEKGRLADLRRSEILDTVSAMLPAVNPVTAEMEIR